MPAHRFGLAKTYSESNQFKLACPIFNVEVPIAGCFKLREVVWTGERPNVRRGCQACMRADKCPINEIVKDLRYRDDDPYYSPVEVVGRLEDKHLAAIAPVSVPEYVIKQYPLDEKELAFIQRANALAKEGKHLRVEAPRKQKARPKPAQPAKIEAASSQTVQAAISGDMSAAINKAAEQGSSNGA